MLRRGSQLLLTLMALACAVLPVSCSSPPSTPPLDPAANRYVDELQWFELSALREQSGLEPDALWILAVLNEQLAGRRLLVPYEEGQLSPGVADIQLEYDTLPLPGSWSSPPGELQLSADSGLLHNTINFTLDPDLLPAQRQNELTVLEGSFALEPAHLLLDQARLQRSPQPLQHTNPETRELWLLGRAPAPLSVNWQIDGVLGGVPFSFSASQQLTAVSSYFEVTILDDSAYEGPDKLLSRHRDLLAGKD